MERDRGCRPAQRRLSSRARNIYQTANWMSSEPDEPAGQSRLERRRPFPFLLRDSETVTKAARLLARVIPAQAGIQARLSLQWRASQRSLRLWVPAFAGTTRRTSSSRHDLP